MRRASAFRAALRGNELWDAPHAAVLYGGNEHLFESNDVHHVLMETGDAGAFYTGRDWTTMGNVLRGNFVHELGAQGKDANTMGFYFDDCDCGDEVYGNVFWNVARGIMIGGGRDHPVRGNVFANCAIGLSIDTRGLDWTNWNQKGTSWALEEKAEKLHYREEPWKSRYPLLAKIMEDDPQEPKYDPVENNLFLDCRKVCALPGNDAKGLKELSNLVMRANLVVNTVGTNAATKGQLDARAAGRAGFRTLDGSPSAPVDLGFVDAKRGDFRLRHFLVQRRPSPAPRLLEAMVFTRTRDFAPEFAKALSGLDRGLVLDIYPAREEPIPGVDSNLIFKDITAGEKILLKRNELMDWVEKEDFDVLVTFGAGNIDRFIEPIKEVLGKRI